MIQHWTPAGATVLVLEGDAIVLLDIAAVLTELGFSRIIRETSASQAARHGSDGSIGLAIVDLDRLPVPHDPLTLQLLGNGATIVFTTSNDAVPPPPFDACRVLSKPFTLAQLLAAIAPDRKPPGC